MWARLLTIITAVVISIFAVSTYSSPLPTPPAAPMLQAEPYRVPDVEGGSHYHRPDNAHCNMTTKDHPCDCSAGVVCEKDDTQQPEYPRCQNWCHKDKCDCDPCP